MPEQPNKLTESQLRDWPDAVAEAQRYVHTSTIPANPDHYDWDITYAEETRLGRGHSISALWLDGEYLVQIRMDVYGYPNVSVAETRWVHSSYVEECDCLPCRKYREKEDDEE